MLFFWCIPDSMCFRSRMRCLQWIQLAESQQLEPFQLWDSYIDNIWSNWKQSQSPRNRKEGFVAYSCVFRNKSCCEDPEAASHQATPLSRQMVWGTLLCIFLGNSGSFAFAQGLPAACSPSFYMSPLFSLLVSSSPSLFLPLYSQLDSK